MFALRIEWMNELLLKMVLQHLKVISAFNSVEKSLGYRQFMVMLSDSRPVEVHNRFHLSVNVRFPPE